MQRFFLPIIVSLSLLALTNCRNAEEIAVDCPVERTPIERFSLCLPAEWTQLTQQFGEQGSIVVLLRPADSETVFMRIHVKKDPLQEPVRSSIAFAQRAIELTRETAPNYSAVRTDPVTIDQKETLLHIFDARPEQNAETVRYHQFVTTHEDIAYGFTAIMDASVNEETQQLLLEILTSVRFT